MLRFIFLLLCFSFSSQAAEPLSLRPKAPMLDEEQLSGVYLRGDVGLDFLNNARSPNIGLGLGYKLAHFRGDITLDYTQNKQAFKKTMGLLNGYYDFGTWNSLTPYLGLGLGVTHIEGDALQTQNRLTYALHGGVSYALNQALNLDLSYRFSRYQPISQTMQNDHLVRLGLRMRLD